MCKFSFCLGESDKNAWRSKMPKCGRYGSDLSLLVGYKKLELPFDQYEYNIMILDMLISGL